ncbi:MAG: hypothetical protein CVU07_00320 [Bacteroidetes bacterium HGW-Bacteroidetes-23]|nr:MAG: hypothetical protein CVU07_00320 [Bacteroidetes bacterium HGW-Bacteroidetes-23]
MNKIETWKKYELFELFNDLEKAEKLLAQFNGGYSEVFFTAEDFHKSLVEEINEKKYENVPDFRQICMWFAPTSVWDDFVGVDGMELANQIYERAYKWDNKNDKD